MDSLQAGSVQSFSLSFLPSGQQKNYPETLTDDLPVDGDNADEYSELFF